MVKNRRERRFRQRWWLFLILCSCLSPSVAGFELRLETGNDFLTNNPTDDDLYTFGLELDINRGPWTVRFGENSFTDKSAELRFDETFVAAGRRWSLAGSWSTHLELGLVHVGRGLFGQDVQNALHRIIGDDEIDFDYVASDRLFPTIRVAVERPLPVAPAVELVPRFELESAPEFKTHLLIGLGAAVDLHRHLVATFFAGGRLSDTSYGPLRPWIAETAAAASAGVVIRDRFFVSWSFNRFGTERQHLHFGYKVRPGSAPRRSLVRASQL